MRCCFILYAGLLAPWHLLRGSVDRLLILCLHVSGHDRFDVRVRHLPHDVLHFRERKQLPENFAICDLPAIERLNAACHRLCAFSAHAHGLQAFQRCGSLFGLHLLRRQQPSFLLRALFQLLRLHGCGLRRRRKTWLLCLLVLFRCLHCNLRSRCRCVPILQSLPALRRLCVLRSSLCLLQSLLDGGLQLLLHLLLHLRVCRCRWQVCRRWQLARASAARQHDVRCLHGAGRRSVPVDIRPHRLVDEIERFIQIVHGLLLARNVIAVDAFTQALRLLHDELRPLRLCFRRHVFRSGRHCAVSLLNGLVCLVHLRLLLLCRLVAADCTAQHRERKRRHEVCGDLFFRRLFICRKIADRLVHARVRHAACCLP